MKVIQVGPKSVHVASFVQAVSKRLDDQVLISEEQADFKGISKEFTISFRGFNPISIYKNYTKLKKILSDVNPNVVHIHQVNRAAFFVSRLARKLKIPVVTTAWGSDVLLIPKKNAFYKWLVKSTLNNSDIITGDSEHMISQMLVLEGDQKKFRCIQYGIDPVEPVVKEKIIYSNRFLLPLYRVEAIVDYFSAFSTAHPEWKLVIASTGDLLTDLEIKVATLNLTNKVEFIGWQESDENRSWYAKSSIYISIPESDGTSVSVLEALSANCIPVLSDIPVSREWIENGVNGIIESENSNPFESALKLNWEKAIEQNTSLIEKKAIRAASIAKFYEIYKMYGRK